jgi:receptor protein-tyrosine kinase
MASVSDLERPDLVRRAAALMQSRQGAAPATPHAPPPFEARTDYQPQGPAPAPAQGMPKGRTVNLSPTVMASKGIFLPSAGAGFVPTIEEFRLLKRHVLSTMARARATMGVQANRLLVTSACPGDGKTFTAINLALSLAFEHDRRVTLVDADSQRQSMVNYLGISVEKGWIDMLSGEPLSLEDIYLSTNIPNLGLIPSGKHAANMPELISSKAMQRFIESLHERDPDRIIIFDSLPCLVSNEPAIFSEKVGQVVFVVASDETKREEVQTALRLLTGCPNVGLVLNKGPSMLSETFGKYGYGYYKTNSGSHQV